MHWVFWVIAVLMGLNALSVIASIGKERKPITHGMAIFSVLVNALLIAGLFAFWGK